MKKKILAVSAVLFMSLGFIACGNDDPAEGDGSGSGSGSGTGTGGGNTEIPGGGNVVNPTTEKEYIEGVSKDLVNLFSASDFQDVADVAGEIAETGGNGPFEDFIEYTEQSDYDETYFIKLSNMKGSYSASYKDKTWKTNSKSGDLNMSYTASDGKVWSLSVTHSGSWGVISEVQEERYYYYYEPEVYTTTHKIDIPKSVRVILKKGNDTAVDVNVNITDLNISNNKLTPSSKVSYNLTAKIKDMEVSQSTTYNPNGNASVNTTLKKAGKDAISVTVEGNTSTSRDEITNGNANNINVSILNKLVVKGKISDVKNFTDALDEASRNDENESTVDRCISRANSYIDIGLYNGTSSSSAKQASVIFNKDYERMYGYTYYKAVPVMKFSDGTTYSFEEYFTESRFESLINLIDKKVKEFENLAN